MSKNWKSKAWRFSILIFVGGYLLLPLYAMLDFSTRPFNFFAKGRSLESWRMISKQEGLGLALSRSIILAILVMAVILFVIVPTIIWVELRLPKLRRPLEFLCLLPLAIPAIVLVVGVAPIYRWISIHITESPISLVGVYSILILPYTYRSLAASLDVLDIHTLSEAAQTLGASVPRMLGGIIMPTLRSGILNGSFIAIALVLGEFTISNILNYKTFQVVIAQIGRTNGNVAVAVSLASITLVLVFLLLIPTSKRQKQVLDVDVA